MTCINNLENPLLNNVDVPLDKFLSTDLCHQYTAKERKEKRNSEDALRGQGSQFILGRK